MGSPAFILQQILDAKPGRQAESIAQTLQTRCAVDTQKAIGTGRWSDGCMLRLTQPDLANLQTELEQTGNRRALELTAALVKTQHIYIRSSPAAQQFCRPRPRRSRIGTADIWLCYAGSDSAGDRASGDPIDPGQRGRIQCGHCHHHH